MVTLMNNLSLLLVNPPKGLWVKIIMAFNSNIANYALAIICLTLVIKLLMFPLDFVNKKVTRKNAKMQAVIQPELDVLKKKYANNSKEYNQKTMEVYKKHGYNVGGSCLVTLISLALTMVVFFTLLAGLNKMSNYKVSQQYEDLKVAYYNVQTIDEATDEYKEAFNADPGNLESASARVVEKYNQTKDSFLWIENVWVADVPYKNPVPKFDDYAKLANLKFENDEQKNAEKAEYEKIFSIIDRETRDQNGYLVITIIVIALGFLQQFLANVKIRFKKKSKLDNEVEKKPKQNIVMLIVMPLILGGFSMFYNSVFGLYMITSSLFAVVTTPFLNTILDVIEKKEEDRKKQKQKLTYSRK